MDRNEQARQKYALALIQYDALNKSVRRLAELVNEHTLLVMAIAKRLGTTPQELVATLKPEDFVNPDDNDLIDPKSGPVETKDEPRSH